MSKRLRVHIQTLLLIGLVTVFCHLPAFRAPFVWDDMDTIVQNPQMQKRGGLYRYFDIDYWRQSHAVLMSPYRPVREILLGGMRGIFGPDARAFHALNVFGHMLNAMLVYILACLLLEHRGAAAVAALVFALQPVHIEVVAWSKNVGEIICVTFALLSMIAYLRWLHRIEYHGKTYWWVWAAASVASFALALLTKESALAVPLILTVWAALKLRGRLRQWGLATTAPLWVMAGVYLAVQMSSEALTGRVDTAQWILPSAPWLRVMLVLKTIVTYLGILLFPVVHSPWRMFAVSGGDSAWQHGLVLLGVLALGLVWLWTLRRRRLLSVTVFWTVVAIGPAANIVVNLGRPLAEQRMYFPSAGFAMTVGAVLLPLLAQRRWRSRAVSIPAVLLVAYGALQWHGLDDWQTEHRLWVRSVRHSPYHAGSHCNLGNAYTKIGHYGSAVAEFEQVRRIKPDYPNGLMNLGGVLRRMGRFDDAMGVLLEATRVFPQNAGIWNNIGNVCYRRSERLRSLGDEEGGGRWLAEAIKYYEKTLALNPFSPQAHANLGNCYLDTGDLAKSEQMFRKAIQIYPEFAEAHYNLGRLHMIRKQLPQAIESFLRANRHNPFILDVYVRLGQAYTTSGKLAEAETWWEKAIAVGRHVGEPAPAMLEKLAQLAQVQEAQGKRDAAHQTWLAANRIAPGHRAIREALQRTAPHPESER